MKRQLRFNAIKEKVLTTKWQVLADHHITLLVSKLLDAPDAVISKLNEIDISELLLILGQNRTRTSLIGEEGLPPDPTMLLSAATLSFNEYLTVCGRAYTKHSHRSSYWAEVKGSPADINKHALTICQEIVEQMVSWNVYEHTIHGLIFEVRNQLGFGARWKLPVIEFIGFVDDVDPITHTRIIQ